MAITSVGYANTVMDEIDWRRMATAAVGSLYGVDDYASFRVTTGVGDRAVSVSAGGAFGLGVRDLSDVAVKLTGGAVASGSRWDLVAVRRNWSTGVSSLVLIAGTATKALPARNTGFGTVNDQPLALVRFSAGQTAVQEIVDLRCIPADGGVVAFDLLARSYLDRVGTQVRIGDFLWTRSINATGSPIWVYVDVTPDTGWTDMPLNSGWTGGFSQIRRVGAMVSLRLARGRTQGWSAGNQLVPAVAPMFRPDVPWYMESSYPGARAEFQMATTGIVSATNASTATSVTLHSTYPAARPTE